jgi:hypothetical protein
MMGKYRMVRTGFWKQRTRGNRILFQDFSATPLNCHEYSLDFELARGNGVISFREMRKEFERFPAIAGFYMRAQ